MRILSTALFMVLQVALIGQLDTYNFQDYIQAPTRFRGLSVFPGMNGSGYSREPVFQIPSAEERNLSFGLSLPLTYFDLVNDYEFKKDVTLNAQISPRWGFTETSNRELTSTDVFFFVNGDYVKENYVNYNQWFWGYTAGLDVIFNYQNEDRRFAVLEDEEVTSRRFNPTPFGSLRIGWGRMENITNAWHAYRILNRLNYTQLIDEDIYSYEKINSLGNFLDQLKTERIFDDRLRYIVQLQFLDYHLRDEFGVTAQSIKYFTELNDMWAFGISENRLLGQRNYFDLGGIAVWNDIFSESVTDPVSEEFNQDVLHVGPWVQWTYENARPIKRDMQLNFFTTVYANYLYSENVVNSMTIEEGEVWNVIPAAGMLFGFYPTTRTSWEVEMEYRSPWVGSRNDLAGGETENDRFDQVAAQFTFRYFIRTTTVLSGRFNASYQNDAFSVIGNIRPTLPVFLPQWAFNYQVTFSHIFM